MSAVITIMQPILRFLQLLCENHNRDLQVSLGLGSYSSSELPAASDVSAPLPATSILELRAQNGSDIWATEVFVSLSSTPSPQGQEPNLLFTSTGTYFVHI